MSADAEPNFSNALRRSQPLAFLASFSIIIGILAINNKESLPAVHEDAIVTGFLFVFAFVSYFTNQFFKGKDLIIDRLTIFGTYFFFVTALVYFSFIAIKFGIEFQQIPTLFGGFIIFFLGTGLFYRFSPITKNMFKREIILKTIPNNFGLPLVGISFFIPGSVLIADGLFSYNLDLTLVTILTFGFFFTGIIILMINELISSIVKYRRKNDS